MQFVKDALGLGHHHDSEKHREEYQKSNTHHKRSVHVYQHEHKPVVVEEIEKKHKAVVPFAGTKDEAAGNEMARLNNILADYKTQMLALDSSNRVLTEELNRIKEPIVAFERHDVTVQQTHSADRAALADKDKILRSDYEHFLHDAEDLKHRLDQSLGDAQQDTLRANALQDMVIKQEADKEMMRIQKEDADRQRGFLEKELAEMQAALKAENANLEKERKEREALEAKARALQEKITGYEQSVNMMRKEVHEVTAVPTAAVVQSDLKRNVEDIRQEYEATRDKMSAEFEQRASKFYNMWQEESKKSEQMRAEVAEIRVKYDQISQLEKENQNLRSQMAALQKEQQYSVQKHAQLHNRCVEAERDCDTLKKIVETERANLGDKSKLLGEVAVYRDIVENSAVKTTTGQAGGQAVTRTEQKTTVVQSNR